MKNLIKCDYEGCKLAFTNSSNLKRHFLTHTREMVYHCLFEKCEYECIQSSSLRKHIKTNHLKKVSKSTLLCPGCGLILSNSLQHQKLIDHEPVCTIGRLDGRIKGSRYDVNEVWEDFDPVCTVCKSTYWDHEGFTGNFIILHYSLF